MSHEAPNKICLVCEKGPRDVPVIQLEYQDRRLWICPQHLPVLIHEPHRLIGRLPGAERLSPSDIHD